MYVNYDTELATAAWRAQLQADAEQVRLVQLAQGQRPTPAMRLGAWLVARGERLQQGSRREEFVPSTASLRL